MYAQSLRTVFSILIADPLQLSLIGSILSLAYFNLCIEPIKLSYRIFYSCTTASGILSRYSGVSIRYSSPNPIS